jgi:hypothetical protein
MAPSIFFQVHRGFILITTVKVIPVISDNYQTALLLPPMLSLLESGPLIETIIVADNCLKTGLPELLFPITR